MRNSVSVCVGLFIGSIILLLGAESLFPGTLYTGAEAATLQENERSLELSTITGSFYDAQPPQQIVDEAEETAFEPVVQTAAPTKQPDAPVVDTVSRAAQSAPARVSVAPGPTHTAHAVIPSRISIPSVGINSPVIGVGTNAKGEMDVPDGKTNNVGWYKYGVQPGNIGTAVLDAHVYAAFEHLAKTNVGDDIHIEGDDGTTLHFRVTRVATYALDSLDPTTLFAASNTRDINLITCAGTFVKSIGTYDHRTIVSATLID